MPDLRVVAGSFTGTFAGCNGTRTLNVSRQQFFKFATTMGTSHSGTTTPTMRLTFAVYRTMAIRCAVDFNQPRLQMSADFGFLETSEKSNISFWIGMTVAAIVADHVLNVPRLIHAKKAHGLLPLNPKSRQMADLVGKDPLQQWHVIEAKARQRSPTTKNRQEWKAQADNIASIGGVTVSTKSSCYAMVDTTISAVLTDPPQNGGVDLRIGDTDLGMSYYAPYVEFFRSESFQGAAGRQNSFYETNRI